MEKLENITKKLKEEIEKEKECMERFVERKDYHEASVCQERIIAYEKAIYIVNTMF